MRDLKDSVPSTDWFCQRCDYLIWNNKKSKDVKCIYCEDLTGIMIPLSPDYSRSDHNCSWVHITCVNWIKDIHFKEREIEVKIYESAMASPAPCPETTPESTDF